MLYGIISAFSKDIVGIYYREPTVNGQNVHHCCNETMENATAPRCFLDCWHLALYCCTRHGVPKAPLESLVRSVGCALPDTCKSKLVRQRTPTMSSRWKRCYCHWVALFHVLLASLFLDADVCKRDSRNSSVDWTQTLASLPGSACCPSTWCRCPAPLWQLGSRGRR